MIWLTVFLVIMAVDCFLTAMLSDRFLMRQRTQTDATLTRVMSLLYGTILVLAIVAVQS